MKSTAERRIEPAAAAAAAAADYLGPADVVEIQGAEVVVELAGGALARAALAFASPYEPAVGDVLLVIGRAGDHYAIGVLQGQGRVSLRFQGDVDLHAEGGTLRLGADRGVEIQSPDLSVQAERVQLLAGSVVQKLTSFYQRVSDLLSVHARKAHTVVDEASITQAQRASIVTEQTVTINGREVHLG